MQYRRRTGSAAPFGVQGYDDGRVNALWMTHLLWAAAAYNLIWGFIVVCWPTSVIGWLGLSPMAHPEVWQYVGLLVGLFGIAYLVAASDPIQHWPVVLTGLLTKLLGPIGFLHAATAGRMPWRFGWTVLANDLIWWIPFVVILIRAHRFYIVAKRMNSPDVQEFALRVRTNTGVSLLELSREKPLMMVFLRHTGCPFCRESLTRLARQKERLGASGTALVLVHMGTDQHARKFLSRYGLTDVPRVSDPERALYRAFGLGRGSLWQILGPQLWYRGILSMLKYGQSLSPEGGDIFQMPGIFLVYHGHVVSSFLYRDASDRADFLRLTQASGFSPNQALL